MILRFWCASNLNICHRRCPSLREIFISKMDRPHLLSIQQFQLLFLVQHSTFRDHQHVELLSCTWYCDCDPTANRKIPHDPNAPNRTPGFFIQTMFIMSSIYHTEVGIFFNYRSFIGYSTATLFLCRSIMFFEPFAYCCSA